MSEAQKGTGGAALAAHSKDAMSGAGAAAGTKAGLGASPVRGDAWQACWDVLHPAQEYVRQGSDRIRQRPLAAVLIAAGAGYVLGRLRR